MIPENCKCQLSVEHKLVPNGNIVNDIGRFEVDHYTRHATLICPIDNHKTTTENLK